MTLNFTKPLAAMLIRHDVNPNNYIVNEADYPAVFPIFQAGQKKECVATLIDQNWAVTAAHCVVLLYENDFFETSSYPVTIACIENDVVEVVWPEELGKLKVVEDDEGNLEELSMKVEDFSNDIALMKLRNEVDHVTPIELYDGDDETGKIITLLGWGDYGTGNRGISRSGPINDGKFRLATNQITQTDGNYLIFKFEDPESGKALPLEGVNGPGDSGGPALVETENGSQIIGVSSRGEYPENAPDDREGRYGWTEYYVRISKMRSWIDRVIGGSR
ncbi:MAG: trypsin-like serine protease [Microcoleaceae cyanobacterium]